MRMIAALALLLALGGCGLRPLYAGGASGVVAQRLQGITVAPIDGGKAGWLVQNALGERLGGGEARYRLTVLIDDRIEGFGVRADDTVARERRTLRARYTLAALDGEVLLDATAGSDVGIDVVASEYGTIVAEATALERLADIVADQIVARIALLADRERGAGEP